MLSQAEAKEIIRDLQVSSEVVLDALGLPHHPGRRVRPWRGDGPEGIAYHYTGGPDGIRTLRWFQDPAWGNTVSSAHALIFDRVPDIISNAWAIGPAAALFQVPTVLLAPLESGTWCTNWVNDRCLGVELRNVGRVRAPAGLERGGSRWERYSREQMSAAIRLGQVFRALRGERFQQGWIVGHSMIWADRSDPGPLFPLQNVRAAIWDDVDPDALAWLQTPDFPDTIPDPLPAGFEAVNLGFATETYRGDPTILEPQWHVGPERHIQDADGLARMLCRLGWKTWPKAPGWEGLRQHVAYYQRSTLAWKATHPERVLKVDGDAGTLTWASMEARVKQLGV